MDDAGKKHALCEIMRKVHALADLAWPNDGVTPTPTAGFDAIVDIQATAAKALGISGTTELMTGDPRIDLT